MAGVRVVSKKEAMAFLGISKRTLERRLASGTIASHVAHGPHGPERRVHLPAPPSPPSPPSDDPGTGVTPVPPPSPPATSPRGEELAVLALRALDEVARENARLRALVAELSQPWWKRKWYSWRNKQS